MDFLLCYDTMETQVGGCYMKIKKPKHRMLKIIEIAGITSMSIILVLDCFFDFYNKFPYIFLCVLLINIVGFVFTLRNR